MRPIPDPVVYTIALLALVCAALLAAVGPLQVWAFSLALFGIPHVLVELRWVQKRYQASLARPAIILGVALLTGIAAVRVAAHEQLLRADHALSLELSLGVLLIASALPLAFRGRLGGSLAGLGLCVLLTAGVTLAPLETLVSLAFLHNLTPLGLLWDRLRDPDASDPEGVGSGGVRRVGLGWWVGGLVVFVGLPALAASPWAVALGSDLLGSLAKTGPLTLGASQDAAKASLIPSWWLDWPVAGSLFRMAAYLQMAHYMAILVVMPRLGPRPVPGESSLDLPKGALVLGLCLAGVFTYAFCNSFHETRAAYGVLASIHAWVELPVLLLAVSGGFHARGLGLGQGQPA